MDGTSPNSSKTAHPRRTTLRTFRFPEELAQGLEAEAQKQGMTLNALVSSILAKHIEWDSKAADFGFIQIYKPTFMAFIQKLDDESLEKIGRAMLPNEWKEMASFWFADPSLERVLDILTMRGRLVHYVQNEVKRDGRKCTIVTHHDLGSKWSVVLRGAFDEFVRTSFHTQPVISVGESVVTVVFSIP